MPSLQLFLTFLATAAIFAYMPGPSTIFAAAETIAHGRRYGLMAALGLHLGCYVHVFASAAGLTALLVAIPTAYLLVKLLGAAYLIWLGVQMLRSRPETNVVLTAEPAAKPAARAAIFRALTHGAAVEALNPKTAVFFLALLPQFVVVSSDVPVWLQLASLGAIVNVMFSSADLACVVLANCLTRQLGRSRRMQILMRRAGGTMLIGLGGHLALQKS